MRSQSCVRYRTRRDVEASLWAMAIIRGARTVMVTLLRSPGPLPVARHLRGPMLAQAFGL